MIYLISGESYHLVDLELKKIFKNYSDVDIIDYNKTTMEDIITSINYVSLFNDEKKMIIKNANIFASKKDSDEEILIKYLENPNPNSILVFTLYDKVDERKKITKIIKDKYNYINIKSLSPKEMIDNIIKLFKDKKYNISYDNARYIAINSLYNYDLILNEIDKVFLYYKNPCEIKKEDLDNIISRMMEDNNFKFVDAVLDDNLVSLKILNELKIQKVEPLVLISLLAREYRLMLQVLNMKSKNVTDFKIKNELKLLDFQYDKICKRIYNVSNEYLEDRLISLLDLDFSIKSGKIDKYLGLEMFVLKDN